MPLRSTPHKALAQILRRDPAGVAQYRAELRYFHFKPRAILGMTNAYQVLDETHTFERTDLAEGFTLVEDPLVRQAAVHGPEFVRKMLGLRNALQDTVRTLHAASQADPSTFALAPQGPPDDAPDALPPP